jgi:hypothetical protein
MSALCTRLSTLEAALAPKTRWFVIQVNQDDGFDGTIQLQRLRDAYGLTDRDQVIGICHFGSLDPSRPRDRDARPAPGFPGWEDIRPICHGSAVKEMARSQAEDHAGRTS